MMRDKVILGRNVEYSADPAVTGINGNIIIAGGTGSGKTVSFTEPCLLNTFDRSMIVTMTKRRLVPVYTVLFKQRGYRTLVLDFARPENSTIAYDPLHFVTSFADIRYLATAIVKCEAAKTSGGHIDPYWDNAAISLLSALIAYVLTMIDKPTFADVLQMFHEMNIKEDGSRMEINIDKKFRQLEKYDPQHYAVRCWKTFSCLPIRTGSCVYGTLSAAIEMVFNPELEEMMRTQKNISFEKLSDERTILFVVTSPVNPALNTFVNMFYSQAFKSLFEYAEEKENGRLDIPVHVLCDDFATGSPVQNFPEYCSIFREKGISVTILIQSESQLESIYGREDAVTIINNCDTYIYLGGMDLKTAHSVSERMNVPLDEVLYLPVGQVFICRRGERPKKTMRYETLKDEQYRSLMEEIR